MTGTDSATWSSRSLVRGVVWVSTIVLCLIGVTAGVVRATYLDDAATRLDPWRAELLRVFGRSDPKLAERPAELARFDVRYAARPATTLLHVIPGALFLAFAPFQFIPRLRNRYRALHRWSGRILLSTILLSTVPALYFGLLVPFGGPAERLLIVIMSVLIVTAATRGYLAIRRGQTARHREWMLRVFAVAAAIATSRIVAAVVDVAVAPAGLGPANQLVASLWIAWALTAGAAELWIAHTRGALRSPLPLPERGQA